MPVPSHINLNDRIINLIKTLLIKDKNLCFLIFESSNRRNMIPDAGAIIPLEVVE